MCKVLIIPGISQHPKDQDAVRSILAAAGLLMPKNDPHGFGYAALSHTRDLWGEKWSDVKKVFKKPRDKKKAKVDEAREKFLASVTGVIEAGPGIDATNYARVGKFGESIAAVMAHSRWATCEKGIQNTHPFFSPDDSVALIHNGVISHGSGLSNTPASTCDSELILNGYLEEECHKGDIETLDNLSSRLIGSYAVGALSSDVLDIFRNGGSSLHVGWLPVLKVPVFCTTKELMMGIMKLAKVKCEYVSEFREDSALRFDPVTGEVLSKCEIETTSSWTYRDSEKSIYPSAPGYRGRIGELEDEIRAGDVSPTSESVTSVTTGTQPVGSLYQVGYEEWKRRNNRR